MDFVLVIMIFYAASASIDHIEFSTLKQCEDAKATLTQQIKDTAGSYSSLPKMLLNCFRRAPMI